MRKLGRLLVLLRVLQTELAGLSVLFLTILLTVDVALRYVFNRSVPGGLEISCILLAIMVFFSLAQVQSNKEHIRVDFVIDRLPQKITKYLEIIAYLLAIAFYSVLFLESIPFFIESFAIKEYYASMLRVPIYPAKAAIVIGCGLMVIELIKDLKQLVAQSIQRKSEKEKDSDANTVGH